MDTLWAALGFAAKRFLTVVKVSALPGLLLYVPILWISMVSLGNMMDLIPELAALEGDSEISSEQAVDVFKALGPFYLVMMLLLPLSLLWSAMVGVPLIRAVVLDEKPGFFRLDGIVWRYFFGQILFFFLIVAIVLATIGLAAGAIAALETAGIHEAAGVGVGFIAFFFSIFVILRLSLFMVEVAVSGKFGVRAAFRVTRGNVWRIIGLGFLALLVLIALSIGGEIALFLFGALALAANLNAIEAASDTGEIALVVEALRNMAVSPVGGIFAALYTAYLLFLNGFQMVLPAFIYKNLGGGQD
jgi:hypothetical protein